MYSLSMNPHFTILHRVGNKIVGCWVSTFETADAAVAEAKLQRYDVVEVRPTTADDKALYSYVYVLGDESY